MSIEEDVKRMSVKDYEAEGFDSSLYTKVPLKSLSAEDDGKKVEIFGWVSKCTALKKFSFVELTSHFSTVKCVLPGSHNLTFCTSLILYGTVKKVEDKKDEFPFEIQVEKFMIYNGVCAPSFPLNSHSEKESRLDYGHLALRMKDRSLFLKARSTLLKAIRDYYYSKGHTEITPPTIGQIQVEGGSTLFKMDYYGETAYLTQSSQLYLETAAPVAGSVFCIMPSYRAEKSKTSRHLSEYTHVEAELVDITFKDLTDTIEGLVRYSTKALYDEMLPEIKKVYPDFEPIQFAPEPFKRITYKDAIQFLISKKHLKPDGTPYEPMDDICDASEKFLVSEYGGNQPVFMTHFPVEHKPFYMRKVGGVTESCDLLFPDIGEIAGASMRSDKFQELEEGFKREGIDTKPYYWYLDMARYGPSMHGGYGLGFERLLMGLMRYKNVDEATLYPRKVTRCAP